MLRLRSLVLACAFAAVALSLNTSAQVVVDVQNINIVNTPVPGSGHDYIKMLDETVNPANGSVSLRIEAPVPKQRGDVNFPFYVFGYDSGGVIQPQGSVFYHCSEGGCIPVIETGWTNSAAVAGGPGPTVPGLIAGGFVANAGVGQLFWHYVNLQEGFYDSSGDLQGTATCNFNTGPVYIDPYGTRHSWNLQWISQNGIPGNNSDAGCEPFNTYNITSGGDAHYQAEIIGEQLTPPYASAPFAIRWTDAHGRGPNYLTGGAGTEDSNGNCCGPSGTTTIVNKQVTQVAIPGLAYPYYFNYGTATRNYTPNSVIVSSPPPSAGGCELLTGWNGQFQVVTIIYLPNSQYYTFGYDPTYGLLDKITYPTGATVTYAWAVNPMSESLALGPTSVHCEYRHDWPYVQTRTVSFDGVHPALQQTFSYATTWGTGSNANQWTQKTTTVTTQDLLRPGQPSFQTIYTYSSFPVYDYFSYAWEGQTAVENSIVYRDWDGGLLRTVTKNWGLSTYSNDPLLLSECTTLPSGATSGVFYTYGSLDVVTDKKEYDYGILSSNACAQGASPPTAPPTRETKITPHNFPPTPFYPANTNPLDVPPTPLYPGTTPGASIFDRPDSVQIYGNGTLLAETDLGYDNYGSNGITQVTATGHDDANFPAGYTNRGNVTSITKCYSPGSTSPCASNPNNAISTYTFDETGQILSRTDPCGNPDGGCSDMGKGLNHTTTYSYADSWVSGDTYTSSVSPTGTSNTFLTTITYPPTNGVNHIETFSYDYPSGQLTVATDQNGRPTTYRYDDFFARLTQAKYPDGGQTTYSYVDSATPSVTTTEIVSSGTNIVSTATEDGMGHPTMSVLSSDPDGPTYTAKSYDGLGRAYQSYNPTRCSPPTTNCGTETTWGYTTYTYDALGRTTTVAQQDGSTVSTVYDQTNAKSTGICTTVTDETGKSRQSCSDGLGRMTGVWEDPSGLNYETDYSYDALNNLTHVNQKGSNSANARTRSFQYDSLSRLTQATNPESGTIQYSYDLNSNVTTRLAPQANQFTTTQQTTTTYTYDALNRVLKVWHANPGNDNAAYSYDGTAILGCPGISVPTLSSPQNLIGHRSAMCTQQATSSFSYDPMGRLWAEARSVGLSAPVTYTTGYTYNQDGSLHTLTYPSTDVVTYTVGGAGRVTQVSDSNNNNFVGYSGNRAVYAPNGSLASMINGYTSKFAGIVTSNVYNDRLQPILLSAGPASGPAFSLCYDFHLGVAINTPSCQFSASTSGDNGNVFQVLDNVDSTRSAAYVYDSLNRIAQAYTLNTTSKNCWGETFSPTATAPGVVPSASSLGIDAWGNLTNRSGVSGMSGNCHTEPLNAAPASISNQLNGFCYDAAGNLVLDQTCPSGSFTPTYYYNSENQLYNPNATYTYTYDADGVRAQKAASATVGTKYWPGPGGEFLMETNGSGTINEEYIYFNGERIARVDRPSGTVHYYFSDELGSSSTLTDALGNVQERYYYYPYGGLVASIGSDPNHYLFTGKERDSETGNDYFGARYYGSGLGRFMTPDWAAKPTAVPYAMFGNPQSLNLYSYVNNNPTTTRDPDGHFAIADDLIEIGVVAVVVVGTTAVIYTSQPENQRNMARALDQATDRVVSTVRGWFAKDKPAPQSNPAPGTQTDATAAPAAPAVPLPPGLVGTQDDKSGPQGDRHNSGPLDTAHGGVGDAGQDFSTLTGGKSGPAPAGSTYPPGTQVGDNGVVLRPARGNSGPRIDIPANGAKPHETLHYPPPPPPPPKPQGQQ